MGTRVIVLPQPVIDADLYQPVLHRFGDELGAVVGRYVFGLALTQAQRVERLQDVFGAHPGANRDRKILPDVPIQHRQHLVAAPNAELVLDEVPFHRHRHRLPGSGLPRYSLGASVQGG